MVLGVRVCQVQTSASDDLAFVIGIAGGVLGVCWAFGWVRLRVICVAAGAMAALTMEECLPDDRSFFIFPIFGAAVGWCVAMVSKFISKRLASR